MLYDLKVGIRQKRQLLADENLLRLYDQADLVSNCQSKHGRPHAHDVLRLGCAIMDLMENLFPGAISEWVREVYAPIALFTHDIGRCVSIDGHERHSVAIVGKYLKQKGMPKVHRIPILWAIRNHRANCNLEIDLDHKDKLSEQEKSRLLVWAILVIADKCIGDAERVRGSKAWKIQLMKHLRVIPLFWRVAHGTSSLNLNRAFKNIPVLSCFANDDQQNNLANFAIKRPNITIDPSDSPSESYRGALVLNWQADPKIATMEQIMSVEWFSEAFHLCARACKFLDFVFRIEYNGVRYFWNKDKGVNGLPRGWSPLQQIEVIRSS